MRRATAGVIVVFAKVPEVGRVKTRLTPPLTPEQASDFYAEMLADVLVATARFARDLGLAASVAVHPWDLRGSIARLAPPDVQIVPQRGVNLGARMKWAVREAAAAGARRILLRGSDSPALDDRAIREALDALSACDLVLRPDCDGGYSLVGLRQPSAGLFDHPMSTRSVLGDTLANARALGLRAHVTETSFDVDTAADLRRLAEARAVGISGLCPRTLAYLDANALWPAAEGERGSP